MDAAAIIEANQYLTLATADGDGRPWASPVWFAPYRGDGFAWVSRPGARHSQNLAVRAEVALVVFDSTVPIATGQGLYVDAVAGEVGDDDVDHVLAAYTARSLQCGGVEWSPDAVTGDAQFRLYLARATAAWMLDEHDQRVEVTLR